MKISKINFRDSIETALSGDARGFEFIYNQTYRYYRAMIIKYFPNPDEVDDLLQDIYIQLYEKLKDLRAPENFFPWSKKVVQNMIKNELRHRSGKMIANTEYRPMYASEEEGASLEDISLTDYEREYNRKSFLEDYNPELAVEKQERKELIIEMLNALPEMQRTCILLWQEGYSTKEMAETLNIPTGTVLSNINYAKKKIKANVLTLEKKGTKLYGMAPLTFFLWLLEQFDLLYPDTLPAKGDTVLWGEISKACGNLFEQAAQTTANVISDATQGNTVETAIEQSVVSTENPMVPPASQANVETTQTGVGSMASSGKTGAAQTGKLAASAVVKGTATFTGHSLVVKIVAILAVVVTVGTGGYFGYKYIKTTSNAFVDVEQSASIKEKTKENLMKPDELAESLGYYPLENTIFETKWKQKDNNPYVEPITYKENTFFAADYVDLDSDNKDEFYVLFLGDKQIAGDEARNIMTGTDGVDSFYNLSVYEKQGGKWVSSGTVTFPTLTDIIDNFKREFYIHDNKFYFYDRSTGSAFYEGYIGIAICQYENEKLNKMQLGESYDGTPTYWLNFIGSMYEEDAIKNKEILRQYDVKSPEAALDYRFEFDDTFELVATTSSTPYYDIHDTNLYDNFLNSEELGPIKIRFNVMGNKIFTKEQLDKIRKDLGVPDSETLTVNIDNQIYYWYAAGMDYVNVSFDDGKGYASAKVDVETAELAGNIYSYTIDSD